MTRRYFVESLPVAAGLVPLGKDEAVHATRVMRIGVGDSVILFDGQGREASAVVASAGRNDCVCASEGAIAIDREPDRRIEMGVALPKPDRARELVERLTEIGVARLTPIVAARTQRPPSDSLLEKLRRAVIEACKQSGRNQLMLIDDPVSSGDYFSATFDGIRLIAHPTDSPIEWTIGERQAVSVAVGPEGGWTDEEVQLASERGFARVDLGQRIYRIETAAVVLAARFA